MDRVKLPKFRFGSLLLLRRFLRSLDRMATAQEQQTQLLQRLVDHLAPELKIPESDPADLESLPRSDRDEEQASILAYIARFNRDTGREPTEDEVLEYLEEGESDGARAH